jgi:GDP-D-mannose dehydratase
VADAAAEEPEDYVIATGVTHGAEFVEEAFGYAGLTGGSTWSSIRGICGHGGG